MTVDSTLTASSLNAVNLSYSTLQGGTIQSQSIIASTLTGSTINFANLTFSTLLASTMTANVMFPLSLRGSTMNISNLLTVSSNVGIGTTVVNYPLTVSNTAFGAVELNRASTATNNFYAAGTVYTVTDPANINFKGNYAYAFGGASAIATTSQSQARGYYAIDVANASGLFGSDTAGAAGAMFYMDSAKTYFQNTALGVGTLTPSWPLTVAKDLSFAAMTSNPLDAALVITGKSNTGTLKIGTYYTGLSFGAAIQSSQFSGSDTVGALVLNPLGGNVGIGINNPTSKLHVIGDVYASGTIRSGSALTIGNRLLGTPDNSPSGNFWIGLNGSASEASRVAIAVIGNQTTGAVDSIAFSTGSGANAITMTTSGNSTYSAGNSSYITYGPNVLTASLVVGATPDKAGTKIAQVITTDGNLHLDGGNGKIIYYGFYAKERASFNTHDFYGAVTMRNGLTVAATGLTVTGAASLNSGLTVTGNASLNDGLTVKGATELKFGLNVSGGATLDGGATVNGPALMNTGLAVLGNTRLRGYVGIGTDAAETPLHVVGSQPINGNAIAFMTKGSSSITAAEYFGQIYENATIYANGSIWAGGIIGCVAVNSFTYQSVSDQRIKKDIQPVHDVFDLIQKIEVVSYKHIDQRRKTVKYGVVAQQLQPFFPEVISTSKNWVTVPFVFATSHTRHENQVTIVVDTSSPELRIGRKIRLYIQYDNNDTEYDTEIINLTTSSITCKVWDSYHDIDGVFVYGIEVNDFLVVDKNQLSLLSLAGVQELHKTVSVHESTIASLQSQNALLLSQYTSLQERMDALEARLNA
jgi:hypothetical protein